MSVNQSRSRLGILCGFAVLLIAPLAAVAPATGLAAAVSHPSQVQPAWLCVEEPITSEPDPDRDCPNCNADGVCYA